MNINRPLDGRSTDDEQSSISTTIFLITPEQKEKFQRDGFVKLEGFLNADVVNTLLARVDAEMTRGDLTNFKDSNFKDDKLFTRAKYDFETDKSKVYELIGTALLPAGSDGSRRMRSLPDLRAVLRNREERQPGVSLACRRAEFRLSIRRRVRVHAVDRRCIL